MSQEPAILIARWLEGDGYEWVDVQRALELLEYLKTQGYEITDAVPEVEVTSSRSLSLVERPPERRRSAAKNQSAPHLQTAFMDEARASMGQPSAYAAMELLDKRVRLTFNVDKPPVEGVLTSVINHPSNAPAYLVLDNNSHLMYPLNSVQAIESLDD